MLNAEAPAGASAARIATTSTTNPAGKNPNGRVARFLRPSIRRMSPPFRGPRRRAERQRTGATLLGQATKSSDLDARTGDGHAGRPALRLLPMPRVLAAQHR